MSTYIHFLIDQSQLNYVDGWIIGLTESLEGFGLLLFTLITLVLSAFLSAIIGLERYRMGANAGMRTHAVLSIGCSFMMTVSLWAIRLSDPQLTYDAARIAAAAVAGIGFLGAGVIIKDKFTIKGLSTATSLWVCSAIGLAVGAGFVLEAAVATLVTAVLVFARNRIIRGVDARAPHVIIEADISYSAIERVNEVSFRNHLNVKHVQVISIDDKHVVVSAHFPYNYRENILLYFANEMRKEEGVIRAEIANNKGGNDSMHSLDSD